jgi:hypothetical protein
MPMKSNSITAGKKYWASNLKGRNKIPSSAVGYSMQNAPKIPKSAPLAPPPRMKISGIARVFRAKMVDQCCANPDSTPADKKKESVWYVLPSNSLEYPTGSMKFQVAHMLNKRCIGPE